jgi:intron-binding protein aquarius
VSVFFSFTNDDDDDDDEDILCSLVRTKTVGHIRDVRRLIVAMSRARLGLYIFGRKELFEQCYELTPAFSLLLKRPTKLMLVKDERFPTSRKVHLHSFL